MPKTPNAARQGRRQLAKLAEEHHSELMEQTDSKEWQEEREKLRGKVQTEDRKAYDAHIGFNIFKRNHIIE